MAFLPIIGMAASAVGGIMGAVGAEQSASAQAAMLQYQAGVAQANAQIAKQNAEYAGVAGEQQSMVSGLKTRALIGETTARMGASGIAVGQGSSGDVLESEQKLGRLDEQQIRENAARKAYGYQTEAASDVAQAGADIAGAGFAKQAGDIKAMSSILGGVSSVSDKWMAGTTSGLFSGGMAPSAVSVS